MKHLTVLLFLLLSIFTKVEAQPGGVWVPDKQVYEMFVSPNKFDRENEIVSNINGENVKGSPYLDTGWVNGTIILKDNRAFKNYKLQYNIYAQVISFFANNQSLDITDGIKEFTLYYNDKLKKRFVNANNYKQQSSPQYFEVLADSKKGMVLKNHKKIIQANTDIANKSRFKLFEATYSYFYYDYSKEKLTSIKKGGNNINEILNLTDAQKTQLVVPRFDFSDEASMLSFFTLYNNLP